VWFTLTYACISNHNKSLSRQSIALEVTTKLTTREKVALVVVAVAAVSKYVSLKFDMWHGAGLTETPQQHRAMVNVASVH